MTTVAARNGLGLVLALLVMGGCNSTPSEQQRMGQGLTYHMDGRWEQAELEYREVLSVRTSPVDQAEVYYNLGQIYEKRESFEQAKTFYSAAIRNYGSKLLKRAEAHMALGAIVFRQGNFTQAMDEFNSATRYAPSDFRTYYNLGQAYEALNRADEAISSYQRALDLRPDSGLSHLSLAFIYEDSGDIDKARFHHSFARRYGVDDPVLVERLTWWNDWMQDEITAVRQNTGSRDKKVEGKLNVSRPRDWRVGNAAQSGTTVARVLRNTAATIIGEQATVQIVGPFNEYTYDRRGGKESLREYAVTSLKLWLESNMKEVADDIAAGSTPVETAPTTPPADGATPPAGTEAPKAAEPTEKWEVEREADPENQANTRPVAAHTVSYVNGATGVYFNVTHTDRDGRKRTLRVYFYLGEKNSYVVVTTRETEEKRTVHALDYLALHVAESNAQPR